MNKTKHKNNTILLYLLLAITFFFVLTTRLQLLAIPLERDEGGFAYIAQHLLQGEILYQDLYDIKLPGLYYTYAAIMSIFGFTTSGIHLGLLVFNLASSVLLYIWCRSLFDNFIATIATIVFALVSLSPNVIGFATHATQLLLPFALMGLIVLEKAFQKNKTLLFLGAGLCLGLAFTIKQQAVYFMLFAGLCLLYRYWKNWKSIIPNMSVLVLGSLLPYLLIAISMYAQGRFQAFWFWTFEWPREFASQSTWESISSNLTFQIQRLLEGQVLIWLLGILGLLSLAVQQLPKYLKFTTILLTICMLASVATGFHFYQHYFVLLLPALGISIALALQYLLSILPLSKTLNYLAIFGVLLLALAQNIWSVPDYYFGSDFTKIHKKIYLTNPFSESVKIAQHLKSIAKEKDQIIVFGSEPQIPFYANLSSVTGHLFFYPATVQSSHSETLTQEIINDIETQQPRFLVYIQHPASWLQFQCPLRDWMIEYLNYYELIAIADIKDKLPTKYILNATEAATYQMQTEIGILVFRRKES